MASAALHKSFQMKKNFQFNSAAVQDCVKQTLGAQKTPIYDWMFEIGLHNADLLVYAAMFDILRHYPHEPQRIELKTIAKRINYSVQSVSGSLQLLRNAKLIFSQGERKSTVYSLFPFDTLDLR